MKPSLLLGRLLVSALVVCAAAACANDPSVDGDVLGCGVELTRIDKQIWVYSNGTLQGTGESCEDPRAAGAAVVYGPNYQCVELASRYFMQRFGVDRPFDVDATGLCRKAEYGELARQVTVKRNLGGGDGGAGDAYVPVHGDLMVFSNAPYGHVGVVDVVEGTRVHIYEQNGAPSGRSTRELGTEQCFIHAYANVAANAP